jgi:hypothetical protein
LTNDEPLIKWPEELTEEQTRAYEEYLKEDHFNALLDYFFITEDPAALAVYVRAGGEVGDQKTRELIASLLEKVPYKSSRTRPFVDGHIKTFMAVEMLRFTETLFTHEKVTLEEAKERVAEDRGISYETVSSQYKEGKKWIKGTRSKKG